MKKILITGSSGYLGTKLVQHYLQSEYEVIGIDITEPSEDFTEQAFRFEKCDILSPRLMDLVASAKPDVLIHSAFVFAPMRNRKKMHEINVVGTRNVLQSVANAKIDRLCVISSATAYGAWPENPVPIADSHPIRARSEFQYSADKGEIEALLDSFAIDFPDTTTSWVRPAIIAGRNFDNYLKRFIFGMPFLVLIDGQDTPMQFVHEDDVVAAIATVIEQKGQGGFNVAPDDWSSVSKVAQASGRKAVRWPFWLTWMIHGFAWAVRFPIHESPPSFLYFARYPWVVKSDRLQTELGFCFRYSSQDTLMEIVASEE